METLSQNNNKMCSLCLEGSELLVPMTSTDRLNAGTLYPGIRDRKHYRNPSTAMAVYPSLSTEVPCSDKSVELHYQNKLIIKEG